MAVLDDPNKMGAYHMTKTVPVGSNFYAWISVDPYTVDSISWTGGTVYASYYPGDPNQAAPRSARPDKNVVTDQEMYAFVIDSQQKGYQISVTVHYADQGAATSTLKFSSVRPSYSVSVKQPGVVGAIFSTLLDAGGNPVRDGKGDVVPAGVVVGMVDVAKRIQIEAKTGPATQDVPIGDFMWMQEISATQTTVSAAVPNEIPHSRETAGFVIDNGFDGGPYALGQPTTEDHRVWSLDNTTITIGTFNDQPLAEDKSPNNTAALYDKRVSYSATFELYLMFKPRAGVWIALEKCDWNFSISVTNVLYGQDNFPNYNWQVDAGTRQPTPTFSQPSGAAAFPEWTGQSFGTPWNPPF